MLLSDYIINVFLKVRFTLIRLFNNKLLQNSSSSSKENRTLFFDDNFTEQNWSRTADSDWHVAPLWGEYHPSLPHQYYSEPLGIRDNCLVLIARYNPKLIRKHYDWDNKEPKVEIPFETSYLQLNNKYKKRYGRFECRCKIDDQYGTWPAFWLSSASTWPPEIDIFELYSGKKGKNVRKQKINLVYGKTSDNTKTSMGAWGNNTDTIKDFKNNFHEYTLEWSPDKLEMFIDGIKVFQYRRKDILDKWYNMEDGFMRTIINHGTWHDDLDLDNLDKDYYSEMLVDYVRIYEEKK